MRGRKEIHFMNAQFLWAEATSAGVNPSNADKWTAIRMHRGQFLNQSDWTQLPDAPLTAEEKTAWSTYRQALRDLPQNFSNPEDVIFPDTP